MSSLEKQEFSPLTQKYNKVELKYYEILCSAISLFKLSWVMHQHDDLKPIRVHLALHHYNTYSWESPDLEPMKGQTCSKVLQ